MVQVNNYDKRLTYDLVTVLTRLFDKGDSDYNIFNIGDVISSYFQRNTLFSWFNAAGKSIKF